MDARMKKTLFIFSLLTTCAFAEDYNRTQHFGSGWIDADGDCQNTRNEVLIAESKVDVVMDDSGCRVLYGIWICPFTGELFIKPIKLDIDHLVPLKEAWLSGADKWTKAERVAYANDLSYPEHLVAVKAGANRSKGARDIAEWLPTKSQEEYKAQWFKVKKKYNLTFDASEVETLIGGQDDVR
jgi:hypothetical protein